MTTSAMLLVRAGQSLCALPLELVGETMRPLPIESMPGTASFVLGLSLVRGEPAPVVSASALLGHTAPPPPGRFVTLRLGARTAMLAVDAVVGVRDVDPATLAALPPIATSIAGDVVQSVGRLDAALLVLFDAARLVPEDAWARVERPR